jgi:hypothetical protein
MRLVGSLFSELKSLWCTSSPGIRCRPIMRSIMTMCSRTYPSLSARGCPCSRIRLYPFLIMKGLGAAMFRLVFAFLVTLYIMLPQASSTAQVCDGGQTGFVSATINKDQTMVRFWLTRKASDGDWGTADLICAVQPKMKVMILGESKDL